MSEQFYEVFGLVAAIAEGSLWVVGIILVMLALRDPKPKQNKKAP